MTDSRSCGIFRDRPRNWLIDDINVVDKHLKNVDVAIQSDSNIRREVHKTLVRYRGVERRAGEDVESEGNSLYFLSFACLSAWYFMPVICLVYYNLHNCIL